VLGALGITLGLSLLETLAVVAAGNVIGCAIFGLFNVTPRSARTSRRHGRPRWAPAWPARAAAVTRHAW
jgi:hypothetical protein